MADADKMTEALGVGVGVGEGVALKETPARDRVGLGVSDALLLCVSDGEPVREGDIAPDRLGVAVEVPPSDAGIEADGTRVDEGDAMRELDGVKVEVLLTEGDAVREPDGVKVGELDGVKVGVVLTVALGVTLALAPKVVDEVGLIDGTGQALTTTGAL